MDAPAAPSQPELRNYGLALQQTNGILRADTPGGEIIQHLLAQFVIDFDLFVFFAHFVAHRHDDFFKSIVPERCERTDIVFPSIFIREVTVFANPFQIRCNGTDGFRCENVCRFSFHRDINELLRPRGIVKNNGTVTVTDTRTLDDARAEAFQRLELGRNQEISALNNASPATHAAWTYQKILGDQFLTGGELAAYEADVSAIAAKAATAKAEFQAASTIEEYDAVQWPA